MIFLVFLMHALLATIFPIGRVANTISEPVFFTGVRMTIAGIMLLMVYFSRNKHFSPRLKDALIFLALFSATGIYLTNVPEFWALQYVPSAKASFIYSLSPFVTALFSYFYFHEKMTIKKMLGMAIGLTGFMTMIVYDSPGEVVDFSIGFISSGEMALIIAAIATVIGWMAMKHIMKHNLCTGIEAIGLSMIVGGSLCFVHSLLTETWNPIPVSDGRTFFICVSLAIICSSVLGYVLYTLMLKRYTATFLSFAGFIEPLCAALFAWFFLGEYVTYRFFIASILVFIGLYLFYQEELKQGYIIK